MSGYARKRLDWSLVGCVPGHHTYAPDEASLREHLRVDTPVGEAWRCLRCGAYVPAPPRGHGPADEAPVPLRGQQLRDAIVLRVLAVDRVLKGLVVFFLAFGVVEFRIHHDAVRRAFEQDLPLLQPLADHIGWDLADSSVVHTLHRVLDAPDRTLLWVIAGMIVYGLLQLAEGVGLWLLRRWGEYLAAVATALFIPIEVYELVERVTWLRVAALVINVAALAFLIYRKRLFGVRGGAAAEEAERHEENLLQVARAAGTGP